MSSVAIVGGGVVGSSWALLFARAGYAVRLYDASPAARADAIDFVAARLADLAAHGLAGDEPQQAVLARLSAAADLGEAVSGADYVQESAPERLDLKIDLYRQLDQLTPPEAVIGSSTSGLPASTFTEALSHRGRCLVVHPTNPPHLIPFVEIVPAPWTTPDAIGAAEAVMRGIGQSPIRLTREINGFVLNRLQAAVLSEAFRLVEDGVCGAADVDKAMTDGLGLRWAFLGPFATIDLNARDGIAQYCANLGPMYRRLADEQADPRDWPPALVAAIEDQLRQATPAESLPARRAWRDGCLARLISARRTLFAEPASPQ